MLIVQQKMNCNFFLVLRLTKIRQVFSNKSHQKNFKWAFHNYTRLLEEGLATFFLNGQKSVLQERMSKK